MWELVTSTIISWSSCEPETLWVVFCNLGSNIFFLVNSDANSYLRTNEGDFKSRASLHAEVLLLRGHRKMED